MNPTDVEILFEDDDLIVVNKPALMYVHPSPGHDDGTLTQTMLRHCPSMATVGSRERPGVVHRLDAETSGVMVFAKNQRAYLKLREEFESHAQVEKTYLAILHGAPKPTTGTLETTIGRKAWDAKRMAVNVEGGKRAVTHWQVLAQRGGLALVEFTIETGRTHQIRVHAAHLGHPVVGDALYGDAVRDRRLRRPPAHQLLHAARLAFVHPASNRWVKFEAPPPADFVYACN